MVQLVDIFSKPEMSLIAGVQDYFISHGLEYQPESLHYDVSTCIGELLLSSLIEAEIVEKQFHFKVWENILYLRVYWKIDEAEII